MKKIITISIILITCFSMLLTLTGCKSKTAITTNDFTSICTNHDYAIYDATSQYLEVGTIKEATIAQSSEGWQIEFYFLQDEPSAINMFNTNKAIFENSKGNTSSETSSSLKNYSIYTLSSNGYYMHLCRIDNTLLYVNVKDTFKDTVKSLIDELGY